MHDSSLPLIADYHKLIIHNRTHSARRSPTGNALLDLFRHLVTDIGQLDQLAMQRGIMFCKLRPLAKLTGAFAPELGVDHDETLVECDGFAA